MRFSSSTLTTSLPGKDWRPGHPYRIPRSVVVLIPSLGSVDFALCGLVHLVGLLQDLGVLPSAEGEGVGRLRRYVLSALLQFIHDPIKPELVSNPHDGVHSKALVIALVERVGVARYTVHTADGPKRKLIYGRKSKEVEKKLNEVRGDAGCGITYDKGGYIFEFPNSGKGRKRIKRGALWQDHGLVSPSTVGTPLLGDNLNRAFKATLRRAGLPAVRLHDLRHTCATLLLGQGVNPKYVQELLGHADISLTLNVYSHILPDMGDAAAGAMDAALG